MEGDEVAFVGELEAFRIGAVLEWGQRVFCGSFWGSALRSERKNMQMNAQERRMMRRFDMRLPAVVHLEGANEFHTETQNVSARGVYFYLDRAVAAGTKT